MKKSILLLCTLTILFINTATAKDLSIQQRLAKIEKQMKQPSAERNNITDIVIQNQKMQQQIAELKGVIEEQNHQIQSLKDKQKLLYIDIDSRLTELEAKPSANTSSPAQNTTTKTNTNNSPALTVEVDEGYNDTVNVSNITQPQLSSDQDDYDIAFSHLRAGRFLESARAFEDFIQKYPDNELTDNAYYWLGESYYVKRQYPQALAAFQILTSKYPVSSKAPDSWLKIGYSYYEMDDLVKADENLQKVIDNYPNTSIARLAKNRLRQLQRDH